MIIDDTNPDAFSPCPVDTNFSFWVGAFDLSSLNILLHSLNKNLKS